MRASTGNCRGSTRSASDRRWPANLARSEARGPGARLVVQPHDVLFEGVPPCVAGREAEDFRGLHTLIADPRAPKLLEALDTHSFQCEDRPLRLGPTSTVIADVAVGAHHAVTWDEVRDRVVCKGGAHGAHSRRMADLARPPAVRSDLAARNLIGLAQHRLLKGGEAAQVKPKSPPALQLVIDLGREI